MLLSLVSLDIIISVLEAFRPSQVPHTKIKKSKCTYVLALKYIQCVRIIMHGPFQNNLYSMILLDYIWMH